MFQRLIEVAEAVTKSGTSARAKTATGAGDTGDGEAGEVASFTNCFGLSLANLILPQAKN